MTPSGHTVIAMATTDSDEAAALALARVGCSRAVALDRGSHRPTFLHRAGGGMPPLARYDESVLYAISRPMIPRAFRWSEVTRDPERRCVPRSNRARTNYRYLSRLLRSPQKGSLLTQL